MSWPCYMVELHPEISVWRLPDSIDWLLRWSDLKPGAMWLDDGDLCVKLPSNSTWQIDTGRKWNESSGRREQQQWTRTGEPPLITVMPSINHVGEYHGWLQNGFLTDDIEGRRF